MADVASPFQVTTVRPDESGWPAYVSLFADYRAHYDSAPPEPKACDEWLRRHLPSGALTCYLAHNGESCAAMALVLVSPASQRLAVYWQLRDLFVAPQHRRTGVGRAVVTAVVDGARAAGALRVALQTESGNAPAQALYHQMGFEDVTGFVTMTLTI